MQSSKGSKNKIAEENAAPESDMSTASEGTSKPRTSRSSKLKKETSDTGSAKHRKVSSPETFAETSSTMNTSAAGATFRSAGLPPRQSPSQEEIAELAHSYWVARGYAHGSPEEDWIRAEHELKAKR